MSQALWSFECRGREHWSHCSTKQPIDQVLIAWGRNCAGTAGLAFNAASSWRRSLLHFSYRTCSHSTKERVGVGKIVEVIARQSVVTLYPNGFERSDDAAPR